MAGNQIAAVVKKWNANQPAAGLLLCLLAVNAVGLFPLLTTGYFGDDILNSQIRGEMIQSHRSLWGVTQHYAGLWIKNEGRLFPLSFYMYSVFYFIHNAFLYKLFVLSVVLASLAALFVFLLRFTQSAVVPAICLFLLPIFVQFRSAWDPILGFCAQYPLLTLVLFCSLNLYLRALDTGDGRALAVSALLFLGCCLIFETSYLLCLIYPVVAFSRIRKVSRSLTLAWPFLAVAGFLIAISLALKKIAAPHASAYTPNYEAAKVIKAYLVQSFGALPFSYYWLDPHRLFSSGINRWPAAVVQGLPLLVVLAVIAALAAGRKFRSCESPFRQARTVDVMAVGALLFTLPQALISLSPRYQAMPWGFAYLPVYITRIGLALLLAAVLAWFLARSPVKGTQASLTVGIVLALWTTLFAINLRNNWLLAIAENQMYWSARVLTEGALRRGLLREVPSEAVLLVDGAQAWDNANEYSSQVKRSFLVQRITEPIDLLPAFQRLGANCAVTTNRQDCTFSPDAPIFTVQIRHLADGRGAVFLAHVVGVYQVHGRIVGLVGDKLLAYFSPPEAVPMPQASVSGLIVSSHDAVGVPFQAQQDGFAVTARGRDWLLATLPSVSKFDALSLQGITSPPITVSTVSLEKDPVDFELHSPGNELLHQGFRSTLPSHGVMTPPITFTDDMSVELLVTPGAGQVAYADILSNHSSDFRGIAIEQREERTNLYTVVLGDGTKWVSAGDLQLKPSRLNYISLQLKNGRTELYLNGEIVESRSLAGPIASTDRPVYLGNWIAGGRQFNGVIDEVLISQGARSAAEVHRDSVRILRGSPANSGGK